MKTFLRSNINQSVFGYVPNREIKYIKGNGKVTDDTSQIFSHLSDNTLFQWEEGKHNTKKKEKAPDE